MPTIQHNLLTGSEIHEPKGIDTASDGEIYEADGAGGGSWVTAYTLGWEDFNHGGGTQSLSAGSYIDLLNDGAGSFTNTSYQIPGYGPIWDVTNNEFNWSAGNLQLGDVVEIRIDFDVTTSGANHEISIGLDMAHGAAGEYRLKFYDNLFKSAATYNNIVVYARVYMGDASTLNNPAKVIAQSDSAGDTIQVNGWFTTYTPYRLSRS